MGSGKMSMPGISHPHTICGTPEDTEALHEALEHLIAASGGRIAFGFGGNPKDKSAVRGGPLFEMIFNVHHLLEKRKVRNQFDLTFFAPMPNPGARMGEKAAESVHGMLEKIHVAKQVGKKIVRFDEAGVVFEDNSRLDADLTVFVPAGSGHPLVQSTPLPQNEMAIEVPKRLEKLYGVWYTVVCTAKKVAAACSVLDSRVSYLATKNGGNKWMEKKGIRHHFADKLEPWRQGGLCHCLVWLR